MKNLAYIIVAVVIAAAFSSCDKIDCPYVSCNLDTTSTIDTTTVVSGGDTVLQYVIIEDFTGFHCQNCPLAHDKGQELIDLYGDRLIVVGIHASAFADPGGLPPTDPFGVNLITAAGTEYDDYWTISTNFGYPKGMVSRTEFDGDLILNYSQWQGAVQGHVDAVARLDVRLDVDYNESSRVLNTTTVVEAKYGDLVGDYSVTLYLIEDSIETGQAFPGGVEEDEYMQRHVLRDNPNGTWGEQVITASLAQGDSIVYTDAAYTVDAGWDADKIEVIAYVYDLATQEIVQVTIEHLTH